MKKLLKKYLLLLDKMKFREFMYVPVSMFFILFIVVIAAGIHNVYLAGMKPFLVFIVLFSIPLPIQFYFVLRIIQWLTAKLGLEELYMRAFKHKQTK